MIVSRKVRFTHLSGLCVVTLLLNGCVSWVYTPGKSELKALCEKDGGVTLDARFEVEGYYNDYYDNCNGCWTDIYRQGFQYVELNNRKPNVIKYLEGRKGYWRVFKAPKGSSECSALLTSEIERYGGLEKEKFLNEYCIAIRKLEKPEARFGNFEKHESYVVNRYYGSVIGMFEDEIRDMDTGEVVARSRVYKLSPWQKSALNYGVKMNCTDVIPSILYGTNLKSRVLIPSNTSNLPRRSN